MSSLSQLVLMHSDPRTAAALSFGFEREGTKVMVKDSAEGLEQALVDGSQLLIAGSGTKDEARKLLAMAQGVMMGSGKRVPVMYFGNAISREDALSDGANEFVSQPAFIRDVVTLAKLMATPTARRTQSISGELGEHFGLFYIVRALGTINNTGVLSLIRGLRRGELRFYQGELTSAQLGALHGLSALHQLLLWTNARFDLREERVVHRRQIPLTRPELLSDCERFLNEIQSIADGLSPSAVLEPDPDKDASELPKQVSQVLALFDGKDSVADVIEDSPFRVFETLRIACRLTEQGFIRRSNQAAPTHLMHTALAIEEWLVGGEVNPGASSSENRPRGPKVAAVDEASNAGVPSGGKQRARSDISQAVKKPVAIAKAAAVRNEQSWSDVLPSRHTTEELAQIVPATAAAGEISVADLPSSRAAARLDDTDLPEAPARERLEERGDLESLSKIFIDESLGPVETGMTQGYLGGSPGENDNPSWDDITSPAKALTDPEAAAAVEAARTNRQGSSNKRDQKEERARAFKSRVGVITEELQAIPETISTTADTPRMTVSSSEQVTPTTIRRSKLDTQPAPMPELPPESGTNAAAEAAEKANSKPETKSDSKSEAKSDSTADTKSKAKADSTADTKSEAKADSTADTKSEAKADSTADTKSESKSADDSESARVAHEKVAATASDAVAAAAALLAVAAHKKPKATARKRHDSKSDSAAAAAVMAVTSAAGDASSRVTDFSADEEAFFKRGVAEAKAPPIPTEDFEDLDEGYELPKTFWQRFMSDPTKTKRKKK